MRSCAVPIQLAKWSPETVVQAENSHSELGLDLFRQEVAAEAIRTGRRIICAEDSDQPPTFRLSVRAGAFVFETRLLDEAFPPLGNADLLVLW